MKQIIVLMPILAALLLLSACDDQGSEMPELTREETKAIIKQERERRMLQIIQTARAKVLKEEEERKSNECACNCAPRLWLLED